MEGEGAEADRKESGAALDELIRSQRVEIMSKFDEIDRQLAEMRAELTKISAPKSENA